MPTAQSLTLEQQKAYDDPDGPTVTAYAMAVEITLPASSWEMTSDEARVLAGMILDAVREAEAGVR